VVEEFVCLGSLVQSTQQLKALLVYHFTMPLLCRI